MARNIKLKIETFDEVLSDEALISASGGNTLFKQDQGGDAVAMVDASESFSSGAASGSVGASASSGTTVTSGDGGYGFASGSEASAGASVEVEAPALASEPLAKP